MTNELILRIFDVEHGACAILCSPQNQKLAMIDCGHNSTTGWRPSTYIRYSLNRSVLDYLFILNADQDHISDLYGFNELGVYISTLHRNWSPNPATLRILKEAKGKLTDDMEYYLRLHANYTAPAAIPFNDGMDGVTYKSFCNSYPDFEETNNLSLAVFIKYGGFKILFPGDLHKDGWEKLLNKPSFITELKDTDILVASHHGRVNGFCEKIFDYFTPSAVVISDKPIAHKTQESLPDYSKVVNPRGVIITNQPRNRHVLTTRRDGDILFHINENGDYRITTAKNGCSRQVA